MYTHIPSLLSLLPTYLRDFTVSCQFSQSFLKNGFCHWHSTNKADCHIKIIEKFLCFLYGFEVYHFLVKIILSITAGTQIFGKDGPQLTVSLVDFPGFFVPLLCSCPGRLLERD